MAITVRNKKTEELIRTIGRRTGEGPSAIILRLAEAEMLKGLQDDLPADDVVKARMRAMEESRIRHTHTDDPKLSWSEIEREMGAIFGDDLNVTRARG